MENKYMIKILYFSFSKIKKNIAMGYIGKATLLFAILHVAMSSMSIHTPKKRYIERDVHTSVSTWHQTDMKVNIRRIIDLLDLLLGDMVSNIMVQDSLGRYNYNLLYRILLFC